MADELEQAWTLYLISVLRGTSRKHEGTVDEGEEEDVEATGDEAAAPPPDDEEAIMNLALSSFRSVPKHNYVLAM